MDPYIWLEDLSDERVLKWIDTRNNRFRNFLGDMPRRLEPRIAEKYFIPYVESLKTTDKGYFLLSRIGDGFKIVLLTRSGERIELIDSRRIGRNVVLKYFDVSSDGSRLAYTYSIGGSDEGYTHIIDTDILEKIDELKGILGNFVWLDRDKYYFVRLYSREKTPDGIDPPAERVFIRESGIEEMVFGEGIPTSYHIALKPSTDRSKMILTVNYGWTRSKVYGGPFRNPEEWIEIYGGDFILFPIDYVNGYLIASFEGEGYGKIILVKDNVVKIIVDELEKMPLRKAVVVDDRIMAHYLRNCLSLIRIFDLNGRFLLEKGFSPPGTVSSIHSNGKEAVFKYESFTIPYKLYQYEDGRFRVLDSMETAGNFVVKEFWTRSYDGTKIHLFAVKKPTSSYDKIVLYGYGGFNIALTPYYLAQFIPFIEDGGVFVVANIRGGGEYGEKWHRDGIREKKKNVFEDFKSAIKFFKERGSKIVAMGKSNGGLLVAAVLTQNPELLDGAVIGYPVLDMLRFHKLFIGKAWIPEYGDPENPEDRKFLEKYSPYHNIKDTEYPPVLVYTGLHDDRVHPAHALKFVAKMEEKGAPIYLRVETVSGHSGATPQVRLKEYSDILAFIYKVLQVKKDTK